MRDPNRERFEPRWRWGTGLMAALIVIGVVLFFTFAGDTRQQFETAPAPTATVNE